MSDYDDGGQLDPGYTGNDQPDTFDHEPAGGVDYGHYEAGQEHDALNQLHQDHGSESDYGNQFGQYEQDHHAAESTDFSTGHHTEFEQAPAIHAESDDFTNYSHDGTVDDHVFGAEGSEHAHQAGFDDLDALEKRFDASFADGTEVHGEGGAAGISAVSS